MCTEMFQNGIHNRRENMTKHESIIWFLFKEFFSLEWINKKCPNTLLDMRKKLKELLDEIEKRLEMFD